MNIKEAAAIARPLSHETKMETLQMTPANLEIEIIVAGEGNVLTAAVEYQFHRALAGIRESGGNVIVPQEPAHIEIQSIYFYREDGTAIDLEFMLTKDQIEAIEAEILEDY